MAIQDKRHFLTQRVQTAMQEIENRFLAGLPIMIYDIADDNGVSRSYLYKRLEEIAKKLGVTREDLLRYPKTFYERGSSLSKGEKVDIGKLHKRIQAVEQNIQTTMTQINSLLSN